MRDSQDSKGGILDEMPDSREQELREPTSNRKANEGEGGQPPVTEVPRPDTVTEAMERSQ